MNKIDHFNFLYFIVGDVVAGVDHLHLKWIHLVSCSYIVIEDNMGYTQNMMVSYLL
jgi:hypothetical protein